MKYKKAIIVLYLIFLFINNGICQTSKVDSIFKFASGLVYFDLDVVNHSIQELETISTVENTKVSMDRYIALNFIKQNYTLIFDHNTDENFKNIYANYDSYPISIRQILDKTIVYYLFHTHQIQFMYDFFEAYIKDDFEQITDVNDKMTSLISINWCYSQTNSKDKEIINDLTNIALEKWKLAPEDQRNGLAKSYYYRNIALESIKNNEDIQVQLIKLKKAKLVCVEIGHKIGYAFQSFLIAKIENNLGNYDKFQKEMLFAIENINHVPKWEGFFRFEYGKLLISNSKYQLAIDNFMIVLESFLRTEDEKIPNVYDEISVCYFYLENYKESRKYYNKLKEYLANGKDINWEDSNYRISKILHESENQNISNKELYEYFELYHNMSNSGDKSQKFKSNELVNEGSSRIFDKKVNSQTIGKRTLKRIKIFVIFILVLLLVFGAFFLFSLVKYKEQKRSMDSIKADYLSLRKDYEELTVKLNTAKDKKGDFSSNTLLSGFIKLKSSEVSLVKINNIICISARRRVVDIYTKDNKIITARNNLKFFEQELPGDLFVKIYRSYIINLKEIKKIKSNKVQLQNNMEIPVGDTYKVNFFKKYGKLNPNMEL